jgi:hypothetical protein
MSAEDVGDALDRAMKNHVLLPPPETSRRFVDAGLDTSLLFFPQRSFTSTKNRIVGSSLDK